MNWIPGHFDPSVNSTWGSRVGGGAPAHQRIDIFSQLREWSSIIGIITAIVGNILISFALNIQRYAHIRIDQEYHAEEVSLPRRRNRPTSGPRTYRTASQEQMQVVEERAKLNAEAPGPGDGASHRRHDTRKSNGWQEQNAHERSPLLKRDHSDSTLNSAEKGSDRGEARKSYLRSPYWWAGIILMTIGEAGNFLAYGFAPASIVSPLGVVALVSNCIIAPFMLKERFRMRDAWGVLIAIAGAVTVVLSAKNTETKMGPHDLWNAILRWEFLTYVGVTAGVIVALMFASPRYGDRTILIDLGLVGLFGGYTALSTKGVASMLSDTLWRALTFPITYLLVLILVSSALMQIRYVNRSLQRFDSTQVIPTQFVLFTLSVIIGSAVLYRDFESTTATRAAEFVAGCLLTFFGVYLLTSGRSNENEYSQAEYSEEEGIYMYDEEAEIEEARLSKHSSAESAMSQKRSISPPRTPDGKHSESGHHTGPHTPVMSSSIAGAPSSSDPQISAPPISPFSRAQSNATIHTLHGSPNSPTFTRLRPTQSHDQSAAYTASPDTPRAFYLRSPSTPTPNRPDHQPQQAQRAAEAALRAHLTPITSPAQAEQNPAIPTTPNGPYPTLNRAARGSFNRLIPGPLVSPLSSGLSAVVADSLRRGQGSLNVRRGSVGGLLGKKSKLHRANRPGTAGSDTDRPSENGPGPAAERDGQRDLEAGLESAAGAGRLASDAHTDAEASERKKGKLKAMGESLGDLIGRRRRSREGRNSGSGSPSGGAGRSWSRSRDRDKSKG